jgi:hypothetical protein
MDSYTKPSIYQQFLYPNGCITISRKFPAWTNPKNSTRILIISVDAKNQSYEKTEMRGGGCRLFGQISCPEVRVIAGL